MSERKEARKLGSKEAKKPEAPEVSEKKPRRPRMSQPISPERLEEIVQLATDLVEAGDTVADGRVMLELLDEVDRLSGNPPTSGRVALERGWSRDSESSKLSKRTGKF